MLSLRTCMVLWLVWGAMSFGPLSAQEAAKKDDPEADPPRTAYVGYRKIKLEYASKAGEKRERDCFCWYPSAEADAKHNYNGQIGFALPDAPARKGKHAVILFSHGYLGAGDQTIFITEGLARAGYIVLAPTHSDSLRNFGKTKFEDPKFGDVKSWDDAKHFDRAEDMHALIDYAIKANGDSKSFLYEHVDAAKIGGVGHSLGGYTIACLSGGRANWHDDRVRAACLYSPYLLPLLDGKLKEIEVPVHLQGGTLDFGITPFLYGAYEKLGQPKSFLVLKNETHFGWTNLIALGKNTIVAGDSGNAKFMLDYTLAFLNEHVREQKPSGLLTEKNPQLDSIRWQTK